MPTANTPKVNLHPVAIPDSSPARINWRREMSPVSAIRRSSTYSAATVSATPGHSFMVVPSTPKPMPDVTPMTNAQAAAVQRSARRPS
jgi:hypothetical protein